MANVTRSAIDIAEQIRKIEGIEKRSGSLPPFQTFEFAGDASAISFAMPKGWKPLSAYDGGSRIKEATGAGFWTAAFDGYLWTVTFGTAPANTNVILIDCWRAE